MMSINSQSNTLQEINISHLGKRKIIFKMDFSEDMLVPRRVLYHEKSFILKMANPPSFSDVSYFPSQANRWWKTTDLQPSYGNEKHQRTAVVWKFSDHTHRTWLTTPLIYSNCHGAFEGKNGETVRPAPFFESCILETPQTISDQFTSATVVLREGPCHLNPCPTMCYLHVLTTGQGKGTWAASSQKFLPRLLTTKWQRKAVWKTSFQTNPQER